MVSKVPFKPSHSVILWLLLASATAMSPFPTEAHQLLFPEAAVSVGLQEFKDCSVSLGTINLMWLGNGRLLQEGHQQLQSCVVSVITGAYTRGISKVTSQISRVTLLASVEWLHIYISAGSWDQNLDLCLWNTAGSWGKSVLNIE